MSTLILPACGVGGGGEDGASADAQQDPADARSSSRDAAPPDAAPVPYRIMGTVTGLVGSLTLSNSDNDESIVVTENGTVAFATIVFDGDPFEVVASEAPKLQVCELSGGSGVINGADSDFTIACDYTRLSVPGLAPGFAGNLQNVSTPKLAMNNAGKRIRAWLQNVGGSDRVLSMEHDGTSWGNIETRSPAGISASELGLDMNQAGDIVLVYKLGTSAVVLSHKKAGTWTDPTSSLAAINPSGSGTIDSLTVAVAASGDYLVAYRMTAVANSHVYLHHNKNGVIAEAPATFDDYIGPSQSVNARFALAVGGGKAVLGWMLYDGSAHQLYRSEYDGTAWSHPKLLTDAVSEQINGINRITHPPVAALNRSGDGFMAFGVHDSSNNNRLLVSKATGGVWSDPANAGSSALTSNWERRTENIYINEVLVSDNGDAAILFSEGNAGRHLYLARHQSTVAGWAKPSDSTDDLNVGSDVLAVGVVPFRDSVAAAAIDDTGNLVVAWAEAGTDNNRAFVAYLNDEVWSAANAAAPLTGASEVDCGDFDVSFNARGEAELSMRYANADADQIYSSVRP